MKPLLLYYALLNWYKAIIHLLDLRYPATTSVLQHGVSVRRSKRSAYQLPNEVIYVYKEGVLQSAASLIGVELPQRVTLGDAIGLSPGLCDLTNALYPSHQHIYPIETNLGDIPEAWFVPRKAASQRGLTIEEWLSEFARAQVAQSQSPSGDIPVKKSEGSNSVEGNAAPSSGDSTHTARDAISTVPKGWLQLPSSSENHPWIIAVPGQRQISNSPRWPTSVLQFLVLYCLASLVRYNPTEWSDIQRWHNETDALFIESYLELAPGFIREAASELFTMGYSKHKRNLREGDSLASVVEEEGPLPVHRKSEADGR